MRKLQLVAPVPFLIKLDRVLLKFTTINEYRAWAASIYAVKHRVFVCFPTGTIFVKEI